jgi:hypothetical protein
MPGPLRHLGVALAFAPLFVGGGVAEAVDVVYVWGEGAVQRVEGKIISETPGEGVRIRTVDGRDLTFAPADVANVVRERARMDVPEATSGGSREPDPQMRSLSQQAEPGMSPPPRYREPAVAFLCSLLVPGGGQFYNGDATSGALLLGGAMVGIAMVASADPSSTDFYADVGLGQSLVFASALTSLIMAPIDASRMNRKNGFHARVQSDGTVGVELTAAF